MLGKFIKLLLLFTILSIIIGAVLIQTPYAQNKLRTWIEEKSEGTLTIGKLEGLVPFWFRLHNVHYQKDSIEASFDQMDLYLSPVSLFLGRLSLLRLYVEKANIQTGKSEFPSKWPSFPFPIYFHSLQIDSLTLNQLEKLSISGRGELSENPSFQIKISYNDFVARLDMAGNKNTEKITLIGQLRHLQHVNMWLSGSYDWKTHVFTGKTHGKTFKWNVKGDLLYSDSILSLSNTTIQNEHFSSHIKGHYNLATHQFQADGNLFDLPFFTKGQFEWQKGEMKLNDFSFHYSDNTLYGNLAYSFKTEDLTGDLTLNLTDFSPFQIKGSGQAHIVFQPDRIIFTLNGQDLAYKDLTFSKVLFEGKYINEQLSFQMSVEEFIVRDPAYEVFPTAHLRVEGLATSKDIFLNGEVFGLGSRPFALSAHLPIILTMKPLDISIDRQAPFSIRLKGHGSIDPILAFLENASLIARGDIDVDLALTGRWDNPKIEGTLVYENGWIESLATGALYRGIHMVLEGEGHDLKIRSLIAHDFDRGDLSGNGHITWDPDKGFPFEFNITAHHFTMLAIDPLTANVDAQLNISGNIHEVFIAGSAEIVEAHLALPNKMPPQVPNLEVTYVNPLPSPKPEMEPLTSTIPIHWDVQVEVPRRLTIEGRGLVSEWRGSLHISGLQDHPDYSGKLKLIVGRFTIIGRTFDLTEGKIQIAGLEPKDIVVDLKGDLELATITASILINGSLDAARVSFASTPPMGSTNQILSWILFNQDVNELTPFQACRLANALASLSGKYSGPSFFEHLKEGLGIDVFDITNCDFDSTDFTFQVGKYISQGTFVGVSKSLSGDFDSVMIQTRIYRNFYLEANYGGSLNGVTPSGGKMIFKWYKSY